MQFRSGANCGKSKIWKLNYTTSEKDVTIAANSGEATMNAGQETISTTSTIKQSGVTFNVTYTYTNHHFISIGTNENRFKGTFDGKNYTIKNLKITSPTTYNIGLFGSIDGATIKNLHMDSANITTDKFYYLGAVAGIIWNGSTVEKCYVKNSVLKANGYKMKYYKCDGVSCVGGVVGLAVGSTTKVIKCCSENSTIEGWNAVGGIVGKNQEEAKDDAENAAQISDCHELNCKIKINIVDYYSCYLSASKYIGGILGQLVDGSDSKITECSYYDNNDYTGATNIGTKEEEDIVKDKIMGIFYPNQVRDLYATTGNIKNFVYKSSIAGKDIIVKGKGFIKENLADYPQPSNITVDALNGGSLIYEGAAQDVKVDYPMIVSKWNLWGSVEGTFDILNSNLGISEGVDAANDIAVSPWNDTTNNWSENYPLSSDNVTDGVGYFVWPFDAIRTDGKTSPTRYNG